MATIVTRAGKGSPLTNTEVDDNFINLNDELATKVVLGRLAVNNTLLGSGDHTLTSGNAGSAIMLYGAGQILTIPASNPFTTFQFCYVVAGANGCQVTPDVGITLRLCGSTTVGSYTLSPHATALLYKSPVGGVEYHLWPSLGAFDTPVFSGLSITNNVGIGTSTPTAKLEVANGNNNLRISRSSDSTQANYISGVGQGGVNQFYFGQLAATNDIFIANLMASSIICTTAGTEAMRIDANRNVGIGTSAPATKLHVLGGDGITLARIAGTSYAVRIGSAPGAGGFIEATSSNEATYEQLALGGSAVIFTTFGGEKARINGAGNVGIGTTVIPFTAGYTTVVIDGAPAGGAGGQLLLRHNAATSLELLGRGDIVRIVTPLAVPMTFDTNNTERLRIEPAGNVGIGLTNPGYPLTVQANASTGALRLVGRAVDSIATLEFASNGQAATNSIIQSGPGYMLLGPNGTERFRVDSSGNVRVGTAALATNATSGFLYIPTCPGIPTGTPTAITGLAPIVINSTNNKLYFYSGGAWRDAGP